MSSLSIQRGTENHSVGCRQWLVQNMPFFPHSSVATRLHCGGILWWFYYKFTAKTDSEQSFENPSAKLRARVWWHLYWLSGQWTSVFACPCIRVARQFYVGMMSCVFVPQLVTMVPSSCYTVGQCKAAQLACCASQQSLSLYGHVEHADLSEMSSYHWCHQSPQFPTM